MANLKVTSKKYNDKDVLELNEEDISAIVKKYQNQPITVVPDDEDDFSKYVGKVFSYQGSVYYPMFYESACWFNISDDSLISCIGLQEDNSITEVWSYGLSSIPRIEGNPTLAGTESELTGLQIDSTKYKVGGGTKLYKHTMVISGDNTTIELISTESTNIKTTTSGTFNYLSSKLSITDSHGSGGKRGFGGAGSISLATFIPSFTIECCLSGTNFTDYAVTKSNISADEVTPL